MKFHLSVALAVSSTALLLPVASTAAPAAQTTIVHSHSVGAPQVSAAALASGASKSSGAAQAPRAARKGCPAPKTCAAYAFESYRWPTTRGIATLGFRVNPLQPWVTQQQAADAAVAAAKTWSAAHGAIRIKYQGASNAVPLIGDGENTIGWAIQSASTLATANVRIIGGKVAEADVTLNAIYPWAWTSCKAVDGSCGPVAADAGLLNRFDIQAVLTHEIGHWLGLAHLQDQSTSEQTMHAIVMPGERKQDTLALGDSTAVRIAYPCRSCRKARIVAP